MTLDEAIIHAEEVASTNEKLCERFHPAMQSYNYSKCAEEHRQLAEWLKDYKRLLEQELCSDLISRQAAINDLQGRDPSQIWDTADVEVWVNSLPSAQSEQQWIPVSERMPKEREWIGTKRFGTTISDEVYVTFECPDGKRFTKHLRFQNGKVPSREQRKMEAFSKGAVPIAWMPLPAPFEPHERKE